MVGRDSRELNAIHRATYDGVAARFAAVNAEMPPSVLDAARQLLAAVGIPARILDVGCGHGRDAVWFAAQGVDVVAADLSAGMLAETQRRITGSLVQLDMRALAFGSSVFDGVWSNAAMLHLPKSVVTDALREVQRTMISGGTFFVSIQVGADEIWEADAYGQSGARFFARYTADEFGSLIAGAGLHVVETQVSCGGHRRFWAHYFARKV